MSEPLFAPTAAPAAAPTPKVVELRPDGVIVRPDGEFYWVCVRRDGRSGSEQRFTLEQIKQLRDALSRLVPR